MKRISILFTILMVMIMLFGSSVGTLAVEQSSSVEIYVEGHVADDFEQMLLQDETLRKYGELAKVYNDFREEQSIESLGGSYYDDNGDLHILLTENAYLATKQELHNNVTFEMAKYSYSQLQEFQARILEVSEEIGFQSTGIRQSLNQVMVYTDGIDNLDYDLLYSLIPQEAVNVEYASDMATDDATYTISPGDKLGLNSSMTSYGTVASGVKWGSNDTYGIMTAGHMGSTGTTVYYNGTNIGDITTKKQSGSIDVALIAKGQTSHTINLSKVVDSKSLDYNGGTWSENTPITAYGATTGKSTGKITDTDYSNTFSGISFTGLIYTTATSTGGDSGAPIVTPYSNSYSMIGVNKGNVGGDLVYTDMQKIKDWFTLNLAGD